MDRSEERRVGKERISGGGLDQEEQMKRSMPQDVAREPDRGAGQAFFFPSRRRHTSWTVDWSSDVCSSDLFRRNRKLPFLSIGLEAHGSPRTANDLVIAGLDPATHLSRKSPPETRWIDRKSVV